MADRKALRLAPVDLDTIKDDLGIPADDTTSDAWLGRRIDALWARFQVYTGRTLGPQAAWIDDWSEIARHNVHPNEPPIWNARPSASVFLRVFPVASVDAIVFNGMADDPAKVVVDAATGKVLSLDGALQESDCGPALYSRQAVVTYTAGFAEIPPDLYEALVGCLAPLWAVRQAQQSGIGSGLGSIARINAVDVGDVEFSTGLGGFVADASRKGSNDPLIGPWSALLDPYVDWRAFIGGALYPTTRPG